MRTDVFTACLQPAHIDNADFEDYDRLGWILFENVLVVQDRWALCAALCVWYCGTLCVVLWYCVCGTLCGIQMLGL